jgi:hypothetical protein
MPKRILDIDMGPAKPLKLFSEAEAEALAKQWLAVYGKDSRGANTEAFMWHVFSGGRYPSLSGEDALARYKEHVAPEYFVLSNNRLRAVSTNALPQPEVCHRRDYYVFPSNLAWTMAFTHESGWLGPYFAMHPCYDVLNKKNLDDFRAKVRKRQEAEQARRNGWV